MLRDQFLHSRFVERILDVEDKRFLRRSVRLHFNLEHAIASRHDASLEADRSKVSVIELAPPLLESVTCRFDERQIGCPEMVRRIFSFGINDSEQEIEGRDLLARSSDAGHGSVSLHLRKRDIRRTQLRWERQHS